MNICKYRPLSGLVDGILKCWICSSTRDKVSKSDVLLNDDCEDWDASQDLGHTHRLEGEQMKYLELQMNGNRLSLLFSCFQFFWKQQKHF